MAGTRDVLSGVFVAQDLSSSLADVTTPTIAKPDRLTAKTTEWTALQERLTDMEQEWQELESQVFAKAKQSNMSCAASCHSDIPEYKL